MHLLNTYPSVVSNILFEDDTVETITSHKIDDDIKMTFFN